MREKAVEERLCKGVKELGGLCLKFLPFYFTGFPDRMVLMPGGRIWFVELKAPGKKKGMQQGYVHRLLQKLGFKVLVLDTFVKVDNFLIETCL